MKKLVLIFSMAILMIYIAGCGTNASYEGKWIASAKSTWDGTIEVQKLDMADCQAKCDTSCKKT